jgi:predicted enzyme related to lactoylglutathione lyase
MTRPRLALQIDVSASGSLEAIAPRGGMRVESERKPPLPILYADDLDATRAAVVAAGGRVLGADHEFPGGRRFHFVDPDGNELAVWTKFEVK